MRIVLFCHSLESDWNHGNAHFLRGVVSELQFRGHLVEVYEPVDGWSRQNLVREQGVEAVERFRELFPNLRSHLYDPRAVDLDPILDGADLVVVHEWNDPDLVAAVGRRRRTGDFRLVFHDSHHRAVTSPETIGKLDLAGYDGVLAFGAAIRDVYIERGWANRVWVWHEAADVRVFSPRPEIERDGDLVWVGNWGDDERSRELHEFLLAPAAALGLSGAIYGVRYPPAARRAVARSGLTYRGWIANHDVPAAFARHRLTIHVPRRPYVRLLRGIPTIRIFEALACGIPLVTAPWEDSEGLFTPGVDYLVARDTEEMTSLVKEILHDDEVAESLAVAGMRTILDRHTCTHRVDELLRIVEEIS